VCSTQALDIVCLVGESVAWSRQGSRAATKWYTGKDQAAVHPGNWNLGLEPNRPKQRHEQVYVGLDLFVKWCSSSNHPARTAADEARFLAALVAEARPYYAPIKAFDLWIVVIAARKQFSFSAHPNSGRLICIAVINISSYDHIHVDRDPCIWRNLLLIPLQVDFPPKKPQ